MKNAVLEAHNLSFGYEAQPNVLKRVSFSLKEGEVLGIIGKSGSGKTTLLKLLAGLLQPASGSLRYDGKPLDGPRENLVPGHPEIKLVQQDFDLMPYLTIEDNMVKHNLSLSESMRKRTLGQLRRQLDLSKVKGKKAKATSGGQKQRVALASALIAKPEVLLLDEPFSNIDYAIKQDLLALLKSDWKPKAAVLVAHEPSDMLMLADRLLVMDKGRVVQEGTVQEVYHQPLNRNIGQLLGPVNELAPELAKALGFKEIDRFLRPSQLEVGSKGVAAKVLDSVFQGYAYLTSVLVPTYDKELQLWTGSKLARDTEIYVQKKTPSGWEGVFQNK